LVTSTVVTAGGQDYVHDVCHVGCHVVLWADALPAGPQLLQQRMQQMAQAQQLRQQQQGMAASAGQTEL
jgi:hypothetical protein